MLFESGKRCNDTSPSAPQTANNESPVLASIDNAYSDMVTSSARSFPSTRSGLRWRSSPPSAMVRNPGLVGCLAIASGIPLSPCVNNQPVRAIWKDSSFGAMFIPSATVSFNFWSEPRFHSCTNSRDGKQKGDMHCKIDPLIDDRRLKWVEPEYFARNNLPEAC